MRAYLAERLPLRLVVPVVALLTIAARVDAGFHSPAGAAIDAAVLCLLFAQFRLWDDLADRARDAVRHPDRVLVKSATIGQFRAAAAALLAVNAAIAARTGWLPLALFLGLASATALWYRVRRGPSAAGDHLILLKYPASVALVSGGRAVARPALVVCSALAVYLAACVYEAVHDRTSPMARHTALVLGEAVLLVAVIVLGVRS